jgi:hypothetical protein
MKLLDYEVLRQYVSNNNADNLFSTIPTTTFALESTPSPSALVALCERKCCWIVILIIAQGRKGNCVTIKNGNSVLWNYRSITLYCITTSNKSCFEV